MSAHDKSIPDINNVFDFFNLASNKTEIALVAFDLDKLKGELILEMLWRTKSS